MRRAFLCCTAIAMLGLSGRAGEPGPNPETLVRLEVEPAAAPKPALRYQLLPELQEMEPGNPIQHYLTCFLDQQAFLFDREAYARREELLAMPLRELPARDEQEYGKSALAQADRAARMDAPDWQILNPLKEDGVTLLLPDVQQMRGLARALAVRLRSEVALGRYDDATRTIKTMFAMALDLGGHPTLIGNLVGIAIASITVPHLEEMLGQPGCPNLYWALSYLPTPLVPIDRGMDGERVIIVSAFGLLDDRGPMGEAPLKRFIDEMDKLLGNEEPLKSAGGLRKWLDGRIKDRATIDAARGRLVEVGLPAERVAWFPAEQVILLDEKREYEVRRDEIMKTVQMPLWQSEAVAERESKVKRPPAPFADALVPATNAVRRAQARIDQRIALLRHVEALRLYAAEHGGKLPARLSEIDVPLPDDPVTGKPFRYELTGATASLRGSPPPSLEKLAPYNVHYEITLRK